MIAPEPERAAGRPPWRPRRWLLAVGAVLVVLVVVWVFVVVTVTSRRQPAAVALPLRAVGELALPGDGSRFDYASLDSERGLLFVARMGASEVIEVAIHSHRVLRTIAALPQVHGVLVVPRGTGSTPQRRAAINWSPSMRTPVRCSARPRRAIPRWAGLRPAPRGGQDDQRAGRHRDGARRHHRGGAHTITVWRWIR